MNMVSINDMNMVSINDMNMVNGDEAKSYSETYLMVKINQNIIMIICHRLKRSHGQIL